VYVGRYKFFIDLSGHGGSHIDVLERAGRGYKKIGRVRIPDLSDIDHLANPKKVPKKVKKMIAKKLGGLVKFVGGVVGALLSVADAEAVNEDEDLLGIVLDELQARAEEQGRDINDFSEEEVVEILRKLFEANPTPVPQPSEAEDVRQPRPSCLAPTPGPSSGGTTPCQ
jgi:SepF-like predicted cell division protein (DUF552 family)